MSHHADSGKAIRAALAAKPRILVVCTGNICRSPMGEVVLAERLEREGLAGDYTVASCGVSAEEQGNPIDWRAASVLREAGYEVPRRQAHRATYEELTSSGLILAMTVGHARSLRRMMDDAGLDTSVVHLWREFDGTGLEPAPEGVFGSGGYLDPEREEARRAGVKRSRYSDFYSSNGEADVPDPWYGPAEGFRETLECVEAGADGIIEMLTSE